MDCVCAGQSHDSPCEIQKCFDKKSKRSMVFLREIGEWKRVCAKMKIKSLVIIIIALYYQLDLNFWIKM